MAHARPYDEQLGRHAEKPSDIPATGWRDILRRLRREAKDDEIGVRAAALAYAAMLASIPLLIACISVFGLIFDPLTVEQELGSLTAGIPASARTMLLDQLREITSHSDAALGLGLAASVLVALWTASGGVSELLSAINTVYDEHEARGWIRLRLTSLLFSVGFVLFGIFALAIVGGLPLLARLLHLGERAETVVAWGKWPLLAVGVMVGLAVLNRYGPYRARPRWRWVSWGAVATTLLWLGASFLLQVYVDHFGSYNETYGSLAGVVVLLLWFYVSAYVVLLGSELNAEIEHQTAVDTTTGPPLPMGQRGAEKADTLPPEPGGLQPA